MRFRDYISTRRYKSGRGTTDSWKFVIFALGREDVLNSASLPQLESLLLVEGQPAGIVRGARSAWRSFRHKEWRSRT